MPRMIEAAATTPGADETLTRMLDLIEAIGRRGAYLALLQQYPQALRRVADLMSASRWGAAFLTRHPILLDEMLDTRNLEHAPDWTAFRASLTAALEALDPDMERQMDVMREQHHAQVFRLLTQDLAGLLTVEKLADHLSELADIMLDLAVPLCWRRIKIRHREDPRFAVISYGKLGGKELGYASDLDMVFLYDDDHPDAQENYARLAQRTNTWLSTQTSAGMLFETDLRLRPNGDAGLLAVSVESFRDYLLQQAWVWEHQALTRARFVAGDAEVGARFEAIREEILTLRREPAKLKEEVLAMRRRMLDAHASNSEELFDLKQDPGGIIDVEFIVQYLILAHAHAHPELTKNLGNIALLGIAAGLGLIPDELAGPVQNAYREYRRMQHAVRLNGNGKARVERAAVLRRIDAVRALWQAVFAENQTDPAA
jgi:glutamate-ammonia-ligase adenylyltransferase